MIRKIVVELRALRIRNRITMMELSLKIGISQRHISFVENHRAVPTLETLQKMADGLGAEIIVELVLEKKTA